MLLLLAVDHALPGQPGALIFGHLNCVASLEGLAVVGVVFFQDDQNQGALTGSALFDFCSWGYSPSAITMCRCTGIRTLAASLTITWREMLGGAQGDAGDANPFGPLNTLPRRGHQALD